MRRFENLSDSASSTQFQMVMPESLTRGKGPRIEQAPNYGLKPYSADPPPPEICFIIPLGL